jgi:DNA repair and recombination protein RAD52
MNTTQQITEQLKQPLDVSRVKKRQGGGGTSLSYIETHDAITRLNQVFGFGGWEFTLLNFEQFTTPKGLIFRQTARLTVHFEGREVTREDVGIGVASNTNGDQLEKGMKEAASDCLKRCARTLGEQFGNSLYERTRRNTKANNARDWRPVPSWTNARRFATSGWFGISRERC